MKPWNYDKDYNASRTYPLVVGLHGQGAEYYMPCIENDNEEMKAYPSFLMAPHSASGWSGDSATWLITQIENLKSTYRIDPNRLYLIGFSMGGSGSYPVANTYADYNGQLFAGIVRFAGQSETVVRDAIAKKTSIWYHIGLNDSETRIQVARDAYQFIKNFSDNASAVETSVTDAVGEYPRTTLTLTKNNIEIMKLSEYMGLDHNGSVGWDDPQVLKWLFSQSLANR